MKFNEVLKRDHWQVSETKLAFFADWRATEQKGWKRSERHLVVPRDWNTIRKDIWGIKKIFLVETAWDLPVKAWSMLRETLKAIRREQGGKPDRRKPLTSDLMEKIPFEYHILWHYPSSRGGVRM